MWGSREPSGYAPTWLRSALRRWASHCFAARQVIRRTLSVAPLARCVRTPGLEHLTDLNLALGAVLAWVDPGKRLERGTLGPFRGVVHRLHLEDPVARDQLLRLIERPTEDGASPLGELDTAPLGAREQPREVDEQSGLLKLVVVPAHRGEEFLTGHGARFRVPFDHQHHPHSGPPSYASRAWVVTERRDYPAGTGEAGGAGPSRA